MRFHVTIKDNETGETHIDQDVEAVLLATSGEDVSPSMLLTQCSHIGLAAVWGGAQRQLKKLAAECPVAVILAELAMRRAEAKSKEKTEAETKTE